MAHGSRAQAVYVNRVCRPKGLNPPSEECCAETAINDPCVLSRSFLHGEDRVLSSRLTWFLHTLSRSPRPQPKPKGVSHKLKICQHRNSLLPLPTALPPRPAASSNRGGGTLHITECLCRDIMRASRLASAFRTPCVLSVPWTLIVVRRPLVRILEFIVALASHGGLWSRKLKLPPASPNPQSRSLPRSDWMHAERDNPGQATHSHELQGTVHRSSPAYCENL